jgi:2-polyprenyl-6-methoxyphenol hydroxylase-like FAD-dependent oxidoreductase
MSELGLDTKLLRIPHDKIRAVSFQVGEQVLPVADFTRMAVRHPYIAIMPQWEFLNFIATAAGRFTEFNLMMEAEAFDLVERDGRVAGVRARTPNGEIEVSADLTIAADGRHSVLRARAGFEVTRVGAPMDVLWFRLPRATTDPQEVLGRLGAGHAIVLIGRGDYWQCGYVILKGSMAEIRRGGLEPFRRSIVDLAPFLRDRVAELRDWEQIKLLTVEIDRLVQWYRPGLLCIGDAAHAMSPVGGVGINLAIQDAIAAANLLVAPLRAGRPGVEHLRAVQSRRELPTRLTQAVQVFVQNRVLKPVLRGDKALKAPLPLRLLARFPWLRQFPARVIGMGFRPEHVRVDPAEKNPAHAPQHTKAQKNA